MVFTTCDHLVSLASFVARSATLANFREGGFFTAGM